MMKSMVNSTSLSPCEAVLASVPDNGIEFGYCGVQQDITRTVTLTNPTNSTVRFTVQVQETGPFSINVTQGKSNQCYSYFDSFERPRTSCTSLKCLLLLMKRLPEFALRIGSLGAKQKKEV